MAKGHQGGARGRGHRARERMSFARRSLAPPLGFSRPPGWVGLSPLVCGPAPLGHAPEPLPPTVLLPISLPPFSRAPRDRRAPCPAHPGGRQVAAPRRRRSTAMRASQTGKRAGPWTRRRGVASIWAGAARRRPALPASWGARGPSGLQSTAATLALAPSSGARRLELATFLL